jgi:uncharacterized protein (DUF2235 family)
VKKLVLFLDGTWNDPDDKTNVFRLSRALADTDSDGNRQLSFYQKGVGTKFLTRLLGGAVGAGLSNNVQEAYAWLVKHYEDNDEIFIFGFSRGAYTARSVAGVIINCGLLHNGAVLTTNQVYERYQRGKDEVPYYKLEYQSRHSPEKVKLKDIELLKCCRRVKIKMIGVWDTVGALGVPWTEVPWIGRRNFYFHNTNLSVLIENSFHALAMDEHRSPYSPTLWTKFKPLVDKTLEIKPKEPTAETIEPFPPTQTIEQRWFIGAHSNVGGGYKNDTLMSIPLNWMQQKAITCGLAFTDLLPVITGAHLVDPVDSYGQFMGGFYKWIKLGKHFNRTIGSDEYSVKGGTSKPINECVDASVFQRYKAVSEYRPKSLLEWAKRRGIDLSGHGGEDTVA